MIRIWIVLAILVFFIRLIRSHMALSKKILISVVSLAVCVAGYLVYSQLFAIDANPQQVIDALNKTDAVLTEYYNAHGKYPDDLQQLSGAGNKLPLLPSGYRLADGFNITSEDILFNRTAERNCAANRAAVMVNYQPYDAEHIAMITK